jgi:alpha-1,2-mannosyltransferase
MFRSLKALKDMSSRFDDVVLVIIGSTRNDDDKRLQEGLAKEALSLGLGDSVRFEVNQPYGVLQRYMASALIGLHTMWNEHFGISVVEMMAAGMVVIAHNSGGPLMDIISPPSVGTTKIDKCTTGELACCSLLDQRC